MSSCPRLQSQRRAASTPLTPVCPGMRCRALRRRTIAIGPIMCSQLRSQERSSKLLMRPSCLRSMDYEFRASAALLEWAAGGAGDFTATVSGKINYVVGSFPSVTGVTTITDDKFGYNSYTLQINTNRFPAGAGGACTICNGHPGCTCWQQFISTIQ